MKLAYEACDKSGASVSATIEAESSAEAVERLRREGLFVVQIGAVGASGVSAAKKSGSRMGGSHAKRIMTFTRQLQLLISTGTPIVQALESVERQASSDAWGRVLRWVRATVEGGAPLSEALRQHPRHFDPIYCSLIAAGETAGKLPPILARLALLTRKQAQVRSAILGAMVYPGVLITIGGCVLLTMMMVVLPRFEGMFKSLDLPLPPTTQLLMVMSHFILTWWWALLAVLVASAVGLRAWLRTTSGRHAIDVMLIHAPILGNIYRSFATARIARLLGMLLDSSLPLLETLGLIRQATRNHRYAELIAQAESAVTRGDPVSAAFEDATLIEPTVCEAMRAGEQSGQVAVSMMTVAEFMEEENNVTVRSLTSILEPVILVVLGVLVGSIAISMFLPLFDLATMGG